MKKIKLNHGEYAIVDDENFDYLNQWKWRVNNCGYANRTEYMGGGRKHQKQRAIQMHALINNTPKGFHTDHINHNKLDNRKCNLRTATSSQNGINRKGLQTNNKSGYTGVYWYSNAWNSEIKLHQKKIWIGRFKLLKDAIKARKKAELIYHSI
jgi:hypothetical protein